MLTVTRHGHHRIGRHVFLLFETEEPAAVHAVK